MVFQGLECYTLAKWNWPNPGETVTVNLKKTSVDWWNQFILRGASYSPELAMYLRMTLNSWGSCLHLLGAGIASMHCHKQSVWHQRTDRGASALPAEPHSQLHKNEILKTVKTDSIHIMSPDVESFTSAITLKLCFLYEPKPLINSKLRPHFPWDERRST